MDKVIPDELNNKVNEPVLKYVSCASAHSDVAEALALAVAPLGDVQTFCSDPSNYRYVVVASRTIIFGYAMGMNQVGFRLDPLYKTRALATGGNELPEIGPEWIAFILFRDNWPQIDLTFWARKAYIIVREAKAF